MQDKLENNYSVYQHVTPDGMYYFGQTQNVEQRWKNNGAGYKETALYPYIEQYGWDNIQHIVLFENQSKEDALWIEDFLITTAQEDGVCINKNRSGLVSKEEGYKQQYYEENKDKRLEYQKQYYQKNRDKELEQRKQRYQKNRDKELEQRKQRYQKNRDEILEQNRQRYQKNRDEILEQRKQRYQKNRDEINERRRQRYQKNRDKINEQRRQLYQRKKEEKQLKELGCLPLW